MRMGSTADEASHRSGAIGFDSHIYGTAQAAKIRDRLEHFSTGKLYLEIGGKLLYDGHASRVLPGFDPTCKSKIILDLAKSLNGIDVIFCISAPDVEHGRVWVAEETYEETLWRVLRQNEQAGIPKPKIVMNVVQRDAPKPPKVEALETALENAGYRVHHRYKIDGYPDQLDKIVSPDGYGKDEYVETSSRLVIVTGLGSSCGKLSTCLGQVYLDKTHGISSGYAKYELFPIWDLPPRHPVNLAYEAATADIGDYNELDHFYKEAYGRDATNYNRDVEAFPILIQLIKKVASADSYMHHYRSPTDMGINAARQGIVDMPVCVAASVREIESRMARYKEEIGEDCDAVQRCRKLLEEAKAWQHTVGS